MVIKQEKLLSYYLKITFSSVFLGTFILVITSILSILQPQIGGKIVSLLEKSYTTSTMNKFLNLVVLFLLLGFFISFCNYIKNLVLEITYRKCTRKIRTDVLETTANFTYEKINKFDRGFIYSRINNSAERMSTLFSITIPTVFGNLLYLVLTVIVIGRESKLFASILGSIILISFILIFFLILYGRSFLSKANSFGLKRHGLYIQTLNGLKSIKQNRIVGVLVDKLNNITKNEYKYGKKNIFVNSSVKSFISLGENLAIAYIISFSLDENTKVFTTAQIYLLVTYIRQVFEPINQIITEFDKMQKSISSYLGIRKLFKYESALNGEKDLVVFNEKINKIEFENVNYSSEKEVDFLKNATFKIRAGEKVALIGEAGKHTIIDLMTKIIIPKSGQIKINEKPLKKYMSSSIRDRIVVIETNPSLFRGTLLDNITLYEQNPDVAKVEEILEETKLNKYLNKNSIIQEFGLNISNGQKELISLARAMYKEGEVYIWHESMNILDYEIQNRINKIIDKISEDKTLVVVAHRSSTIKSCDRVLNVKIDGVKEMKKEAIKI